MKIVIITGGSRGLSMARVTFPRRKKWRRSRRHGVCVSPGYSPTRRSPSGRKMAVTSPIATLWPTMLRRAKPALPRTLPIWSTHKAQRRCRLVDQLRSPQPSELRQRGNRCSICRARSDGHRHGRQSRGGRSPSRCLEPGPGQGRAVRRSRCEGRRRPRRGRPGWRRHDDAGQRGGRRGGRVRESGLLAAGPGLLHISCSTVSVDLTARLAAAHAASGQRFVSAQVLGRSRVDAIIAANGGEQDWSAIGQ